VGIQAVQNVLFGRYKMISREVKDHVYGLYGRPPASINPEVQRIVLKGYERGDKPITCRAADILPPELDKAKEATKDLARDIGDVLIYALYPTTGMRFLRWKYGLEAPPPDAAQSVSVMTPTTTKAAEEESPPATPTVTVAEGETELQAPMPGLITSFSVKEGDWVEAGDTVAIPEAMKMENALPARCSGRIKAIKLNPGDKVNTGETIAIIA
jgi:biotin carboxyl carrier protein